MKKAVQRIFCAGLAVLVGGSSMTGLAAETSGTGYDSMYYTDYATLEEALKGAGELTEDIAAEGTTLLKNTDNALPLETGAQVSVFGMSQTNLSGGQTNYEEGVGLVEALEGEGFRVNPILSDYYEDTKNVSTDIMGGSTVDYGTEDTQFNQNIENSCEVYNDAAIIVISRPGGEGNDLDTVTEEDARDEEENVDGWTHKDQATGKKHELQFTDSEVELLGYVKAQGFKKIIYLINSSNPMELYNIEHDDAVDAIVWMGRPGETGARSVAKILTGEINPSGKLVDTWYKDFTADPTWQNVMDNSQTGSDYYYVQADGQTTAVSELDDATGMNDASNTGYRGLDYEEDIYVGYRYYETVAADKEAAEAGSGIAWYEDNVVYPFGYGLSYTTFAYSGLTVTLDDEEHTDIAAATKAMMESYEGHEAQVETATATVTVTNTGSAAGKETVELYLTAPYYKGGVEKAHVVLIGYEKTDLLQPGESQTLEISFNIQDMASYDALGLSGDKGYVLESGDYVIRAMGNANGWTKESDGSETDDYEEVRFYLSENTYLKLDDYSGNQIENLFSKENGSFYSMRDTADPSEDGVTYQFNKDEGVKMTQLSRSDFEGTFPEAPTQEDLTLSETAYQQLRYFDTYNADEIVDGTVVEGVVSADDYPWMEDLDSERVATWTQSGTHQYQLSQMVGIDPSNDTDVIEEGTFAGMTGQEAWDAFVNELTWEEVVDMLYMLQKSEMESIGMNALNGQDNALNFSSTFQFTDNPILGATWNKELAKKQGIAVANIALLSGCNTWWGGSVQNHRSPFGGRVCEYFSEDSLLTGYQASRVTLGAQSRGVICTVKHCVLNDQETGRADWMQLVFVSEQAMRELYFRPFQMCFQEGGAHSFMGAMNRLGRYAVNGNYNFVTKLVREEWGVENLDVSTDAYISMWQVCSPDLIVRAGTDTWDEFGTGTVYHGEWNEEGYVTNNGERNDYTWAAARRAATNFLFAHVNSAIYENGIDLSGWQEASMDAAQGTAYTEELSVAAEGLEAGHISYSLTEGELPEGLTLEQNGTITGTAVGTAGTYEFTVECAADYWITDTRNFTINLSSAFTADGFDTLKVGEEASAFVYSETISTETGYDNVVYSIAEGALPAGLELTETGDLVGTPAQSGTYTITVCAAAEKAGEAPFPGMQVEPEITNYYCQVEVTVAE